MLILIKRASGLPERLRPKADLGKIGYRVIYRRAAHPLLGESGRICKSGCGEIDICPINGRS
jgi:hypothetical protein